MNTRITLTVGAVLLVAASLTACNGGSSNPVGPTGGGGTPADVTITINGISGGNSFAPNPATVKVGQTVAWRNADSISHTATSDATGFNSGTIAAGATSAPIMMSAAGTFAYHCSFHPTMTGSLVVTP